MFVQFKGLYREHDLKATDLTDLEVVPSAYDVGAGGRTAITERVAQVAGCGECVSMTNRHFPGWLTQGNAKHAGQE